MLCHLLKLIVSIKTTLLLFTILLSGIPALGQNSYTSLKFFGLSLHPYGDENAHLMPLNPDKEGYLVLNLGGTLAHEIQIAESKYSVKALQTLYADCASQLGGFSHIGIRAIVFTKNKHQLTGGIGPTLIFRRNWHRLQDYKPSGFFKGGPDDEWQYKFLWYGGELEYHYSLTEKTSLSTTFVPGFPEIINFSIGIRIKH